MWIERDISQELIQITKTFPVLVLIGPRQVGKTSILEKTFPDYTYATLDIGTNAEAAETRPEEFLNRYPPPVIFDEIQYAPNFFRQIKTYVDKHRNKNGLFILTGSQNFMLMEAVADSLAAMSKYARWLISSLMVHSKNGVLICHPSSSRSFTISSSDACSAARSLQMDFI